MFQWFSSLVGVLITCYFRCDTRLPLRLYHDLFSITLCNHLCFRFTRHEHGLCFRQLCSFSPLAFFKIVHMRRDSFTARAPGSGRFCFCRRSCRHLTHSPVLQPGSVKSNICCSFVFLNCFILTLPLGFHTSTPFCFFFRPSLQF